MPTITHDEIVDEASISSVTKPRIGHDNLFRSGTATASSESSAGPVEQAFNGLTYDYWESLGSATESVVVQVGSPTPSADYMAVAAHTLSGCTLTPQSSANGSSWTTLVAAYVARSNRPIVWEFTATTANYFRLLIGGATGAVRIGAIHVGLKLTSERGLAVGFAPPSLNESVDFTNTMSEGGQILGRSIIRRGAAATISLNHITWGWSRDDWEDFVEESRTHACFFWWVNDGYAEIVYGAVNNPRASFSDLELLGASFEVDGINR